MRNHIKTFQHFEGLLLEILSVQKSLADNIANGSTRQDRIMPCKEVIFSEYLHLILAKYTSGAAIERLRDDFRNAVASIEEIWPDDGSEAMPDYLKDWYVKMIWMLTFGIFLKCSDEEFATIVAVLDKSTRKDWLLEYLIAYRIPGRPYVDTLIFPKPYATLKTAVEETHPQKRSNILRHYLEKEWYPGHKGVYWYDNHKSKHDIFFGYWSFEAAAVVKIAGIDDSSFRDNQYYPKDMLG